MNVKTEFDEQLLKKIPFYSSLNDREKDFVKANTVIHQCEQNNIIRGENNSCLGMITVLKDCIRAYIISEEGREITLFRLQKGDSCVLSSSCVISQITFDVQMTAEKDCELLTVNSDAFGKLTEQNIYVRCYMFETLTNRFSSVMWTMQQILFSRFDSRLASFLVSEYENTGVSEIKMTHEQIAQRVSSAREVVARMLKRFSSDGLVEVRRGSVIIKNPTGLKKIIS